MRIGTTATTIFDCILRSVQHVHRSSAFSWLIYNLLERKTACSKHPHNFEPSSCTHKHTRDAKNDNCNFIVKEKTCLAFDRIAECKLRFSSMFS